MKSFNQIRIIAEVLKKFNIRFVLLIAFPFIISGKLNAQQDTVKVPSDLQYGEGNLNKAVKIVTEAGTLSNTVFLLEPYGYYALSDSILVPSGQHLTIIGPEPGLTQETALPQILCSSKFDGWNSWLNYYFVCEGDLTFKNVWLLYANASGMQMQACNIFRDDPKNIQQHKCNYENVIIDYCPVAGGGGSVTVACKNFSGNFTNCYWKNCTDPHFRYYGRAVSFPYASVGYHIDSLIFENCTFANIGYVLMQEGGEYADFVKFNHCTFLNVVMYAFESGWWRNLSVTNSVFTNMFMFGYMLFYPSSDGIQPDGGTIRIDSVATFGFPVPFTDQERHILFTNSSYYLEDWLVNWMADNPYTKSRIKYGEYNSIPIPQPMLNNRTIGFFESYENGGKKFPFMNKAELYDSTDPGFILPPSDTTAIKTFIYDKWDNGSDFQWAWKPENSYNQIWPLEENLSYSNNKLLTAGMAGFPLGDLYRWFPDKYQQWKAQKELEDQRITYWLNTGKDSIITNIVDNSDINLPGQYILYQNYPNPFNPSTTIKFSVPSAETLHPAKARQVATSLQKVTLSVYDVLGREVASLINDEKAPGNYQVVFNGKGLASGIYFYKLTVNDFTDVKKLILLK